MLFRSITWVEQFPVDRCEYGSVVLSAEARECRGKVAPDVAKLNHRPALRVNAACHPGYVPIAGEQVEDPRILHGVSANGRSGTMGRYGEALSVLPVRKLEELTKAVSVHFVLEI